MVGNRQSQWLLNPPVCVLPSPLVQLPTPAPPFSVARKLVKAVPSGAVPLLLQMYVSFTQCRQLLPATFCSHWSPVSLSVTVPSVLSTKRRVVVVLVVVVVVVVNPPPQHWHIWLLGSQNVSGKQSVVLLHPHVPAMQTRPEPAVATQVFCVGAQRNFGTSLKIISRPNWLSVCTFVTIAPPVIL